MGRLCAVWLIAGLLPGACGSNEEQARKRLEEERQFFTAQIERLKQDMAAELASRVREGAGESVRAEVLAIVRREILEEVRRQLVPEIRRDIEEDLRKRVLPALVTELKETVRSQLEAQLRRDITEKCPIMCPGGR